jgi:hypothetical protein
VAQLTCNRPNALNNRYAIGANDAPRSESSLCRPGGSRLLCVRSIGTSQHDVRSPAVLHFLVGAMSANGKEHESVDSLAQ